MSAKTGDLVSREYGGFRGVDFRGEDISLNRSPDSLNLWKDYTKTDSIRTRPTMTLHTAFSEAVYGVFSYKGNLLVHSGETLYSVSNGVREVLYEGAAPALSDAFVYEGLWYFKDGKNYLQYDGTTIKEVEGYVPTTSIGRKPAGGGTIFEDVNLLTGKRINTFLADGESTEFFLDGKNIDEDYAPIVKINGEVVTTYTVDYEAGKITFPATASEEHTIADENATVSLEASTFLDKVENKAGKYEFSHNETDWLLNEETVTLSEYGLSVTGTVASEDKITVTVASTVPAPLTDGQDNVSVEFSRTVDGARDKILGCTLLQVFDNRVFYSGNEKYPNTVWHCSLDDPAYCSDLDYYNEGLDTAKVKGMVTGNNALWVFRESSDANTNVFYHIPTIDEKYGKIYPSNHSSVTIGCEGRAINFNDDIVFFSARGMEGISGDVTTEQVAAHRSTTVDRKLLSEAGYKDMVLTEWNGYLCVFIDDTCYLADSRAVYSNNGHSEYEFFYWQMEKPIVCAKVIDDVLYLGANDGVYTLTGEGDLESYWVTPKDKFGAPALLKTTNKRGCVAEATGDIEVYTKMEDTDFEMVGTFDGVTDYFVGRIKMKKFKDLQLKFSSKTRFSLERITLSCFVGGYIKR